ncbi:macrophage mannose receptor 1-like [Sander lucioperca]|uniref:macrophage mannose receptor 1-like n=1 Tax=Sander lucioperca TaxID=283035 RepID=UPI00125E178C|nr:macrophage mannose receptor 1-like [Sander lucioperca]
MDKVLLLIMAASGLSAVSSHAGLPYHFVYEQKNMTEAKSYCREKYTDLATVDNMEDVKTLNNMADSSKMVYPGYQTYYNYRAWIGLYDDVDSWRWSLTNTSFYKPGEAEFRRWRTGEPNNAFSKEHCTAMGVDGPWNDFSCESSKKAVCIHVRGPDVTFILTDISMTWPAAQSYCREQYTDLASVRNSTENQKVQKLIPTGESVWIGLFRDSWKWLDGSTSLFRYWKTGEPNNNDGTEICVAAAFNQSGQWEDWNCGVKRAFICFGPVPASKHVIRLTLEKKNSLDLKNPAVMEAMLKQLKQKLKAQGLDDNITLSWRKQADGKVFHKKKKDEL